jgi:hypothetical protein
LLVDQPRKAELVLQPAKFEQAVWGEGEAVPSPCCGLVDRQRFPSNRGRFWSQSNQKRLQDFP